MVTAKVLPFEPTMFTLQRKIQRACREDEREGMKRAAWLLEPLGKEFDDILHDNLDDLLVKE